MICLYCEEDSSCSPSREHVVPDALGGRLQLQDGCVCSKCNHLLNRVVDQPFKALLQPLITYIGAQSSKRGTSTTAHGLLTTVNGVDVPVRFEAGARMKVPPAQKLKSRVVRSDLTEETWSFSSAEAYERVLAGLRTRHAAVELHEQQPIQGAHLSARISGSASVLLRGALKVCLNYLRYRRPEEAHAPQLARLKRHLLDPNYDIELWGTVPRALSDPTDELRFEDLLHFHRIAIGSDGQGRLNGGIVLFGHVYVVMVLSRLWEGTAFHAEHELDIETGANRQIDLQFSRPRGEAPLFQVMRP